MSIENPTPVNPSEKPKSRRICAWCKQDLGEAQTEENTYGVCLDCKKKLREEIKGTENNG